MSATAPPRAPTVVNDSPRPDFPPLLVSVAILVWGYSIELLPVALLLVLTYEAARWIPWRWRFTDQDFHRLVDLTALLFVVVAVYQFDQRRVNGVYGILQWLPGLLSILLLAERFSERGQVPLSAFFLRLRRAVVRAELDGSASVPFVYPYFAVALVSASAGIFRGSEFFVVVAVLLAWGLYHARPRGASWVIWMLLIALVLGLSFGLQTGIKETRRALEPLFMEFMRDYLASVRDPFRSHTALGEVGELKASERIELRLHAQPGTPVPALLHEATYRQFSRNHWLVGNQKMRALTPAEGGLTWDLTPSMPAVDPDALRGPDESDAPGYAELAEGRANMPAPPLPKQRVRISRHMPRGRGLVAVPAGATALHDFGVESLHRHKLGTLKVGRGPEFVSYAVTYGADSHVPSAPGASDLVVPRRYAATLRNWLQRRHINSALTPAQVVSAVARGFGDGYSYSLRLPSRVRPLPLRDFLEESRSGHCEFYATATVLLLRAAGIPARYAAGYAVHEWSPLEEAYIVRRRHAHSWASVFVAGRWHDVDTTPANWAVDEAREAPWWGDIYAVGAWLRYLYSSWRWRTTGEGDDDGQPWLLWVALPLVGYLIWRLRAERVRAHDNRAAVPEPVAQSPLRDVLARLEEFGLERRPGETSAALCVRATHECPELAMEPIMEIALPLHARLRFSANGLSEHEVETLKGVCVQWLAASPKPGIRPEAE